MWSRDYFNDMASAITAARKRVALRLLYKNNSAVKALSELASCILPRLYLTNLSTACNDDELARLHITHLISVLDWPIKPTENLSIKILQIPIVDSPGTDILTHLDKTTEFIREALAHEDANVMVGIVYLACYYHINTSYVAGALLPRRQP